MKDIGIDGKIIEIDLRKTGCEMGGGSGLKWFCMG